MSGIWGIFDEDGALSVIDTARLKAMLDLGRETLLVDVRSDDEFRAGHLPGARHVELGEGFERRAQHWIGQRLGPVVTYANRDTKAAREAAERLSRLGLAEVYVYDDGVEGWRESSLPIQESPPAVA